MGLEWMVKEVAVMMKWFHDEGYAADIPVLTKDYPDLMQLRAYLGNVSDFKMKDQT